MLLMKETKIKEGIFIIDCTSLKVCENVRKKVVFIDI
ncbi:MAG: hypothetical protein KatS3mg068_0018 [Candidatus Sericytochromatia bacterium]|nr:MAG: hypothetical protein KatS3mg068_0018 [Candidatus Sericytochromatia bacterium]